jgi:hypothetical protein
LIGSKRFSVAQGHRQTIAEFKRMSAPHRNENKGGFRSAEMPTLDPVSQKVREAIPHLERMLYEMQGRKRAEAIEPGTGALRLLDKVDR